MMEKKSDTNKKARIQIQVDQSLKDNAEEILDSLGMTPTAAVTMLFKRIVATDSFPIDLTLTDREKASNDLLRVVNKQPVHEIKSKDEAMKWLSEDE
jgi:addiction module antitoxin, RelB/DinJ family